MTAGHAAQTPSAETPGTPPGRRARLALVVTHPIQYYAPLYRRLAARSDLDVRVFFTWHAGQSEVFDQGFEKPIAWDIPLLDGYDWEAVPNSALHPGSDRFWGIQNSELSQRVLAWQPDAVHVTGYAFASHLQLLRRLSSRGVPSLFRGDSTLLTPAPFWKAALKQLLLRRVFRYPAAFLYVGAHNRRYYEFYGVPPERLFACPHSIDVERFAAGAEAAEEDARGWRESLGLGAQRRVLLFCGKFEDKKQPLALMKALADWPDPNVALVLVGDGPLGGAVRELAGQFPERFRVLPFQNQSRMPSVYRLGEMLVLPSSGWETWGLAVNEAFACRRPALVSDQVGAAPDLIVPGETGEVFRAGDWGDFRAKLAGMLVEGERLRRMGEAAYRLIQQFSIAATAEGVMKAFCAVTARRSQSAAR